MLCLYLTDGICKSMSSRSKTLSYCSLEMFLAHSKCSDPREIKQKDYKSNSTMNQMTKTNAINHMAPRRLYDLLTEEWWKNTSHIINVT